MMRALAIAAMLVGCGKHEAPAPTAGSAVPVTRHSTLYGPAVKVSVEQSHVCAVLTSGRVACWGELGGARERLTTTPRLVPGIADAVEVLGSCARRHDGSVACWDDGKTHEIAGSKGARALARGEHRPCLVTALGGVACLADDDTLTPVPELEHVAALGDFEWRARCVVHLDGHVACAGEITALGPIPDLTDAIAIVWAAEGVTCALRRGGEVACFGKDRDGVRGLPAKADQLFMEQPTPCLRRDGVIACREHDDAWVAKQLGGSASDLSCNWDTCCAVVGGDIACWGDNLDGALGDGVAAGGDTPVKVPSLPPIAAIAAGFDMTFAIARTGEIYAWGKFGDGPRVPVKLDGDAAMVAVDLVTGGVVRGRTVTLLTPRDHWIDEPTPPLPADVRSLALPGLRQLCAALADGTTRCLGDSSEDDRAWRTIPGVRDLVQVSSLDTLICGATSTGGVTCFDDARDETHPDAPLHVANVHGVTTARRVAMPFVELANGDVATLNHPAPDTWTTTLKPDLHGLTGFGAAGFQWSPTCAIKDARVQCWSYAGNANGLGALGRDTTLPAGAPAPVSPPLAATAVTTGATHACALDLAGAVWCWGDDRYGQLGRGRVVHRTQPGRVVGIGP